MTVTAMKSATLEPDPDVVSDLRELLEEAEAGRIRGFAFIAMNAGRKVRWCVSGAEARENYPHMHGLLGWLQLQVLERWGEALS